MQDDASANPDIMTQDDSGGEKESNSVQLIAFDLGHVLVDFDWDAVCQGFCRHTGLKPAEFRKVLDHLSTLGYEMGKVSTARFLAELNDKAGVEISLDEFKTLWVATFSENREVAELVGSLKEKFKLYMISNTNEVHYSYLKESYNIERHFEECIVSYKLGVQKPQPEIYQEIMRRSGLPAERCLFIDDLTVNVEAAAKLGMQYIRFIGASDLKEKLAALGIAV